MRNKYLMTTKLVTNFHAYLPGQEYREQSRDEAAVYSGHEEQLVIVPLRPAGGGQEQGAQELTGTRKGGEQERQVPRGQEAEGEEGDEHPNVLLVDAEVQPDAVMVLTRHHHLAHSTHLALARAFITEGQEVSPQPPGGPDSPCEAEHKDKVLPPRDQFGKVPEHAHSFDFVNVEQVESCHSSPVDEELGLGFVFDNDSDSEEEEGGEDDNEDDTGEGEVEAGHPQEARHQDDRKCGGQRYPDGAPRPRHPQPLLRHIEDLPDLVRPEAAALHEAVNGGVEGLAVAAEAEQVRPLPLVCEVLTAAQGLIIPGHVTVTMLMSLTVTMMMSQIYRYWRFK